MPALCRFASRGCAYNFCDPCPERDEGFACSKRTCDACGDVRPERDEGFEYSKRGCDACGDRDRDVRPERDEERRLSVLGVGVASARTI